MTPHDLIAAFDSVAEAPDGVVRLRELVLQLAVRGKLVPQVPADEPASVLLARIAAEKDELACGGRLRRQKMRGSAPESVFEVPQGWLAVWLGDIVDLEYGKSLPAKARDDVGVVPVYGSNGVVGRHDVALVTEPCVVVGRKGSAGAINISASACWPIDTTYFICPRAGMPLKYLALVLTAARLGELDRATAIPGLNREEVYALPVLLPPLAEQDRIVARVDELMDLLDQLEAARTTRDGTRAAFRDSVLDTLREAETPDEVEVAWNRFAERMDDLLCEPADIAPLRQTLFELAVRGRLVPQDPTDEPASVLLERIAADRAAAVAAKLTRMGDDPGGYDEEDTLPVGWEWAPLQDVVQFIDYRGKTPPKTPNGVRLITAKNIRDSYVTEDPREFVSPKTYERWMTRGFPKKGDVLFTTEAPMGKAALVAFSERFALAQRAINLHPYADLDSKYLMWMLLSPWFQERLRKRATGMTATGIKGAKLRLIRVPIPPVHEQHRIVARVDELMGLLDRLEARLTAARTAHGAFAAAAVHHLDA